MSIRLGNHLWDTCDDCGKLVKITGWLRGIHLCATPEEIAQRRDALCRVSAQRRTLSKQATVEALLGYHGTQSLSEASGSAQSEALKESSQPVDDLTNTGGSDHDNRPLADRWELKPETKPEP